jgi:hypothetical protein
MRWRSPVSCHILGNRSLTPIDAEFEEFAVDPGSAPKRVGEAHVADQLADFERDLSVCRQESDTRIPGSGS